MNIEIENIKREFIGYLVDKDIHNENGHKTLEQLQDEYPEEWENYSEEKHQKIIEKIIHPKRIYEIEPEDYCGYCGKDSTTTPLCGGICEECEPLWQEELENK